VKNTYFVQSVYWQLLSPPPTPAASTSTDVLIHIQWQLFSSRLRFLRRGHDGEYL